MRSAMFLVAMIAMFLSYDLRLSVERLLSRKARIRVVTGFMQREARRLLGLASLFTGLQVDRSLPSGASLPNRFLIVSNHQSLADIVVLLAAFRTRLVKFVAKRELKYGVPGISQCLRLGGDAFVTRDGFTRRRFERTRGELERLATLVREQSVCPVIFPEGTRSRDGRLGRFHSGAYRILAESSGAPVVIVALDGGTRISTLSTFRQFRGIRYRIKYLGVRPAPHGKQQSLKLLEEARTLIDTELQRWRAEDRAG